MEVWHETLLVLSVGRIISKSAVDVPLLVRSHGSRLSACAAKLEIPTHELPNQGTLDT